MTDQEINQAIRDHLGLPRTQTWWGFRKYDSRWDDSDTLNFRSEAEADAMRVKFLQRGDNVAFEVEPHERQITPKDYCNDRDAMAAAITALGEDIVYNLIPNQGTPDEDGGYSTNEVFHLLTRPCRDLAVAFYKTIHPDKITP